MFSNIGFPGLLLLIIFALFVFGPNKLPQIGRAVGRSLKEFKDATNGITRDIQEEVKEDIRRAKEDSPK
jgi:sec-independent protein translocase protein TatA